MDSIIEITCESGHRQVIQVAESLGSEYAWHLAGLLDGTSDFYRYPPDDNSVIGKCGICGKKISCLVNDRKEEDDE